MITLAPLDLDEAVRYLGGSQVPMNDTMDALLTDCEAEIRAEASPKYRTLVLPLPQEELLQGADIRDHLAECDRAVLLCCTLGAGIDKLLRRAQVTDMSRAIVLDALASVAVEQVCRQVDDLLLSEYPDTFFTSRFSPGYGDYPLELQKQFLTLLDAPRKIGVSATPSFLLTPIKSVTAIAGMADHPLPRRVRGCAACRLRESCLFRAQGDHCKT